MIHAKWALRVFALLLLLIAGLALHAINHTSGAAIAKSPSSLKERSL